MQRAARISFSAGAGGLLCPACELGQRELRPVSWPAVECLRRWSGEEQPATEFVPPGLQSELRQWLGYYVSFVLGRRPRLLGYVN